MSPSSEPSDRRGCRPGKARGITQAILPMRGCSTIECRGSKPGRFEVAQPSTARSTSGPRMICTRSRPQQPDEQQVPIQEGSLCKMLIQRGDDHHNAVDENCRVHIGWMPRELVAAKRPMARATAAGGGASERRFRSRQPRPSRATSSGRCNCTLGQAPTRSPGHALRSEAGHGRAKRGPSAANA